MVSTQTPNYYEILNCQETDSIDTIKKSYQTLILKYHPDKCASQTNNVESDIQRFHAIDEAWKVLRDTEKRRKYDAQMQQHKFNEVPIVHEIVKRHDFKYDAESKVFAYPCRCSGLFILPNECIADSEASQMDEIYIECDECSFVIQLLGNTS